MESIITAYGHCLSDQTQKQVSADVLQRYLYQERDVFGDLHMHDNFEEYFKIPPKPYELIPFTRFWRGVEDVLQCPKNIISSPKSQKLLMECFVDDDYIVSMRLFRDEILNYPNTIKQNDLIRAISICCNSSNLQGFWSTVKERSERLFSDDGDDEIMHCDLSLMIFGFLSKKFKCVFKTNVLQSYRTASTCDEFPDDNENQNIDLYGSLFSTITDDYRFKYHKLITELDVTLPEFYSKFTSVQDELTSVQMELARLQNAANDEYNFINEKQHLESEIHRLQASNRQLIESNAKLHEFLSGRNIQLSSARAELKAIKEASNETKTLEDQLRELTLKYNDLQEENRKVLCDLEQVRLNLHQNNNQENDNVIDLLEAENTKLNEQLISLQYDKVVLSEKVADLEIREANALNILSDELHKLELEHEICRSLQKRLDILESENDRLKQLHVQNKHELKDIVHKDHGEETTSKEFLNENQQDFNKAGGRFDLLSIDCKDEATSTSSRTSLAQNEPVINLLSQSALDMYKTTEQVTTLSRESSIFEDDQELFEMMKQCNYTRNVTLQISPDLAETRRLNTLNAVKYGHLNENPSLVQRSHGMIQRSESIGIGDEAVPVAMLKLHMGE